MHTKVVVSSWYGSLQSPGSQLGGLSYPGEEVENGY